MTTKLQDIISELCALAEEKGGTTAEEIWTQTSRLEYLDDPEEMTTYRMEFWKGPDCTPDVAMNYPMREPDYAVRMSVQACISPEKVDRLAQSIAWTEGFPFGETMIRVGEVSPADDVLEAFYKLSPEDKRFVKVKVAGYK